MVVNILKQFSYSRYKLSCLIKYSTDEEVNIAKTHMNKGQIDGLEIKVDVIQLKESEIDKYSSNIRIDDYIRQRNVNTQLENINRENNLKNN